MVGVRTDENNFRFKFIACRMNGVKEPGLDIFVSTSRRWASKTCRKVKINRVVSVSTTRSIEFIKDTGKSCNPLKDGRIQVNLFLLIDERLSKVQQRSH